MAGNDGYGNLKGLAVKIEFRNAAWVVVGSVLVAGVTKDEAVKLATEHMKHHKNVESASVFAEDVEVVVSKVTPWMSRNG